MSTLMCKLSNDAVKEHDADMLALFRMPKRKQRHPALCADLVRRQAIPVGRA
ncbi:MAG: hypothetical protein ACLR0U_28195 [Enterocloster clostridioformis]